tara:strand:- start:1 stop:750 length:750 start_codon:yes stop_codon:yes gene_type:complete
MKFGNIFVGKRLFVGWGKPEALGKGETEIRGASYLEGPLQVGKDDAFSNVSATVMIGPENNTDVESHPSDSLVVEGHQTINNGNLHTSNLLGCTGQACSFTGSTINVQGWKGFDIKHPNKDKHRLRHVCVEGPEAAIYHRGRVCNGKNVIDLPDYWRGLIDYETLTVQLTAIHSHQNVIVKRISPIEGKIYLQAQGGMPVDCFYHIMAARVDGEPLIVEYEGESPADYPGDPTQFSISGYDYGRGVNND